MGVHFFTGTGAQFMALQLIYGNSGSGKSTYIYEKVIQMAQADRRRNFYVIVPEQFTMQAQRELVQRSQNHVIVNIDVVSFERLAYRIFDELGIQNTVMEETGKSLVLRKIAEEKGKNLTVLRGNIRKMGYINELKSMISELMQYDISVEELEDFLGDLKPESNLYYKLSDVHTMYAAFEEYLRGQYVTAERVLDVLADAAEESQLLKGAVFAFDGFTGFTPVQMKLLHRCMHVVKDMYVTVTLDVREDPLADCGMQDLFYMSRKMTAALLRAAREEQFPLEDAVFLEPGKQSRLAQTPVLHHLEQNLFRVKAQQYAGDCQKELQIYSLATPREELQFAAWKISEQMRSQGYRYGECAIVCGDVECYEKYAQSVFSLYDIPYFVDMKSSILYHPCIELIRAVLEIVEKDFSYESVFRFLRTGLSGFAEADIDFLENYVLARGIRGASRWKKKFLKPMRHTGRIRVEEDVLQQELARADQLRERFWKQIEPFYEIASGQEQNVAELTRGLYEFLTELQLEEQIHQAQEAFEEAGEELLASQYRQIYKIVVDLLDKLVDLLGEEILSVRDYADVLEEGFASAKVGAIPPGADCVILGDIERTRLEGIKVLFFLGANDGMIPKSTANGGILSQYDRELIEEQKLQLSPTAREQSFLQRFYLYLNMTKPSEALCLTYARMDAKQKAARPSYLIGTLQKLFAGLQVQEIEAGTAFEPLTAKSSLDAYLTGLTAARDGEVTEEWKALHQYLKNSKVWEPVVQELFAAAFSKFTGEQLAIETARQLYGTILTNSVTRLELFARCAYAHFLEYGLKLSERETYSFAALDMGSMFHEILQHYCENLEKSSDWYSVTETQQEELLKAAMQDAVLSMPNESLLESARSAYVLERIYRIMKRSIWALTEQIRHGTFQPAGYEVDFMQVNELNVQNMILDEEHKMRLVGKIDRMDTRETEEAVYVRIIDYKSGKTTFQLLNLYYGQQLQLVVYLNAAIAQLKKEHPGKEIVPAGIFYYRMDDPMVEADGEDEEKIMEHILGELRLNGLVSLEREAYEQMDVGLQGKSEVIPLTLNKDGSVSKRGTSGAAPVDFTALTAFVNRKICGAAEQILNGDIDIRPYQMESKTGCDHCPYHSVCGFDPKVEGYTFRKNKKLSTDEVWANIYREGGDSDEC